LFNNIILKYNKKSPAIAQKCIKVQPQLEATTHTSHTFFKNKKAAK